MLHYFFILFFAHGENSLRGGVQPYPPFFVSSSTMFCVYLQLLSKIGGERVEETRHMVWQNFLVFCKVLFNSANQHTTVVLDLNNTQKIGFFQKKKGGGYVR